MNLPQVDSGNVVHFHVPKLVVCVEDDSLHGLVDFVLGRLCV